MLVYRTIMRWKPNLLLSSAADFAILSTGKMTP